MMLESLPPKGEKRTKAILGLGSEPANAETLLALVGTEKGNNKQAALQALAQLDYSPALPLWQKLLKSKRKGEKVLMPAATDSVSEIIAEEVYAFLVALLEKPANYTFTAQEFADFKTYLSLMLGKASTKMRKVYLLAAQHSEKLSSFIFNSNGKAVIINDYLRFFAPTPKDIRKIFPAVLSMSILHTLDERLITLAQELYRDYQANWLSPVFLAALLIKPAKSVFNSFSVFAASSQRQYLYDTLGALYFDGRLETHVALLFWGQYHYGELDTRFTLTRPLFENLDESWFAVLCTKPEEQKEQVTLQAYNRGGVLYDAYDEMLAEILPNSFSNKIVESQVRNYFGKREQRHNGASELYLYTLHALNCEIKEEMLEKFVICKDNAVSIYQLKSVLQRLITWPAQRKLAFFDSIAPTIKKLDVFASPAPTLGTAEAFEACRKELMK